jgi:S-adenosylmethionine decarboxylase
MRTRLYSVRGATQVGVRTASGSTPRAQDSPDTERKDYFVTKDGLCYAGTHLIIDLWDAEGLDDEKRVEQALRDCVAAAGATLIAMNVHRFSENGGISGIAVLAESHISIHTWPERAYAALDIFMCGGAKPALAIPVLKAAFKPRHVAISEHKRGVL